MNEIPQNYNVYFRGGKIITVVGVTEIRVVSGTYILKTVNAGDFSAPLDVIEYIQIQLEEIIGE